MTTWRQPPKRSVALQRPLGRNIALRCRVVNSKRPKEVGRVVEFESVRPREAGPRGGVFYWGKVYTEVRRPSRGRVRAQRKLLGYGKWYVSAIEPMLRPNGVSELSALRYIPNGRSAESSRGLGMLALEGIK